MSRRLAVLATALLAAALAIAPALAGEPDPPLVELEARSPQLVRPQGAVSVKAELGCEPACTVRLEGSVRVERPAGTRTLRLRPTTAEADGVQAVELALPRRRARVLRRDLARGKRAVAEIAARAVGEGPVLASSEVRLRPAFAVLGARVRPELVLFDGKQPARFRFRFQAPGRTDLRVRVVRRGSGRVVWAKRLRAARPFRAQVVRWLGAKRNGKAAPDGTYAFELARAGAKSRRFGKFRLRGFVFPVAGPTGSRGWIGSFGAPRSGGRTHQGLDITAPCGRRIVAARGGRVKAVRYEPALKGHFAVIRDRTTGTDYVYSHFPARSPLAEGERVRTGALVGRVGQSGNAASTPCHLHFEIWPHGWGRGNPVDPAPRVAGWLRR